MFDPLPDLGWRLLRADTELAAHEYVFRSGWLLLILLVMGPAFLLASRRGAGREIARLRDRLVRVSRPAVLVLALLSAVASLAVGELVLGGVPHTQDGVAYLFQARCLARGSLTAAAPPPEAAPALSTPFLIEGPDRWAGKYPPGWPAVLAPFAALGLHSWANPLLALEGILLFAGLLGRWTGPDRALLGAGLLALSPFQVFMAASLLSHPLGLVLILLLLHGWTRARSDEVDLGWTIGLAGAGLLLIRPLEVPFLVGPILVHLLAIRLRAGRGVRRALGSLAGILLPLAAGLALALLAQAAVTGHPLRSPYLLYSPGDRPGFGPGVGTFGPEGHNLFKAVMNVTMNLLVLNEDLYGWPFLSLLLPLAGVLFPARWSTEDRLLLAMGAGIWGLYFCFMGHGIAFGARYYHGLLPALVWFTLRGLEEIRRRTDRDTTAAVMLAMALVSCLSFTTYVPDRIRYLADYWNVLSDPEVRLPPSPGPRAVYLVPDVKVMGHRDLFDSYVSLNAVPPGTGDRLFLRDGPWLTSPSVRELIGDRPVLRVPLDGIPLVRPDPPAGPEVRVVPGPRASPRVALIPIASRW